jgi:uncharacterized membrane protein YadS
MSQIPRPLGLLPGIALLAALGFLGKLTEQSITRYGKAHHVALPNIEYVLWAIVFGLIVSNTIGVPAVFRAGVATYEFWLKTGIVLLGVRFLLGDILKLGGVSLAFVAIELAVSIALMTALGRWLRLSPKLTSLLAIGSAICGVSAIIAAKGAIEADDEDASYAIAAILALGAFSLFAFPAIGHALGLSDHAFGLWAGLAVDNTAEATAAGALYSDAAAKFAVLAKTAQRDHRFRGAGVRHLLGAQKQPPGRGKQGRVPVAEVPEVRTGIPADFAVGDHRRIHQAADCRSGESIALGFSVDLRGRGPADQHP